MEMGLHIEIEYMHAFVKVIVTICVAFFWVEVRESRLNVKHHEAQVRLMGVACLEHRSLSM